MGDPAAGAAKGAWGFQALWALAADPESLIKPGTAWPQAPARLGLSEPG